MTSLYIFYEQLVLKTQINFLYSYYVLKTMMTQNIDQIIMLWFRFECIWRVLEPVIVVHPHFKIYAFLIIIHCLKSSDKEGCEWYRVQRHWQSVCKHVHGRWSVILTVPVTSLCNLKNCALYNTCRKKGQKWKRHNFE